jgi:hypothetical protein
MFARMKIALERAVGKEWLRIERDVARRERIERQDERDVALWERDDYHRQLDVALGERDEYLRQRDALFEQLERERQRNSSHDLVSALADALARMTLQRDNLRHECDEIRGKFLKLTGRPIEPDGP